MIEGDVPLNLIQPQTEYYCVILKSGPKLTGVLIYGVFLKNSMFYPNYVYTY